MRLQDKIRGMKPLQRMMLMGLFITMALVLSYIENFIPVPIPVPGVKLGLANIITLLALYYLSFGESFLVVILRIVMSSIFVGGMNTFFYSLMGGLLSFVIMSVFVRFFNKKVSAVGISVLGAVFHNIGQLIVVAIVTDNIHIAVSYFPILGITGVVSGFFVGLVVRFFCKHLEQIKF